MANGIAIYGISAKRENLERYISIFETFLAGIFVLIEFPPGISRIRISEDAQFSDFPGILPGNCPLFESSS